MKNYLFYFLALSFSLSTWAQAPENQILIENVQIFNGIDNRLTKGHILIEGNKIKTISTSSISSENTKNITVIDGREKYVIPGLIDAHTHITFEDIEVPLSRVSSEVDWATLNIIATRAAKRRLLRGFTTLRDMGGNAIPIAKAIDKGIIPGPRIYPSGAFISQSGGHGDFGLFTDVPRVSGELSYSERIGFTAIADGPDEVLKRTREQFRQGATQIKMMAGGGVTSDFDPLDASQYTVEEFKAAVSAAENFDSYVSVHAYTPKAIAVAIEGGVKAIEHGHLMDESSAKLMKEKGVWLSIQPFLPRGTVQKDPSEMTENEKKGARVVQGTDVAYRLAKKHQLKTAWGTDIFGGFEKAENEGQRVADMIRWFTPYEILKMVTSNNAEFLRLSGERNPYKEALIGEISEGAFADLIIVDGNPLENIDLIADPYKNFLLIMKDGEIHKNELHD